MLIRIRIPMETHHFGKQIQICIRICITFKRRIRIWSRISSKVKIQRLWRLYRVSTTVAKRGSASGSASMWKVDTALRNVVWGSEIWKNYPGSNRKQKPDPRSHFWIYNTISHINIKHFPSELHIQDDYTKSRIKIFLYKIIESRVNDIPDPHQRISKHLGK